MVLGGSFPRYRLLGAALAFALVATAPAPGAHAALISVLGPNSSAGTAPEIVAAPADILDDIVTNTGMQGFNEAQGVVTTMAYGIDGGGLIAANTRVDSHMIFLNSDGSGRLSSFNVDWTFDGAILGIMSDGMGNLEAASTAELGAPGTNYTTVFGGSGPAAPFNARGLEQNDGMGDGPNDGYLQLDAFTLRVGMLVTEPGDWIRVVTLAPVPEPSTAMLLGLGLFGLAGRKRLQA